MRFKLSFLLAVVITIGLSANYVLATNTDNSAVQIDSHANCDCNGEFEWYDETLTPEMIEQMETQVRESLRDFYENGGDAVIERILNGNVNDDHWLETDDDGTVMLLEEEPDHIIPSTPSGTAYSCRQHYIAGLSCHADVYDAYKCIKAGHTDIVLQFKYQAIVSFH